MSERHYFADVNLPLHVWVREPTGTRGFRWVLKRAEDLAVPTRAARERTAPRGGDAPRPPR